MTWSLQGPRGFPRWTLAAGVMCAVAAGAAFLQVQQRCQLTAVLSGSMAPAIAPGSIVLTCARQGYAYRTGDIILFPSPQDRKFLILHRLSMVYANSSGAQVVSTRGDANALDDGWQTPLGAVQGRVVFRLPYGGFLVQRLRGRISFLFFALGTFLLFVVAELRLLFGVKDTFNSLKATHEANGKNTVDSGL
jgi:signal peptidase I